MSQDTNLDQSQTDTTPEVTNAALLGEVSKTLAAMQEAQQTLVGGVKKLTAHLSDPKAHGAAADASIARAIPKPVMEGTSLVFKKENGEQLTEPVDLKGDKGEPGEKGKTGDTGAPGSPGQTGPMPDHQWDGTSLKVQKPDGSWPEVGVDLKGAKGDKGEPGKDGAPGEPGPAGGPKGDPGEKGDAPDHQWEGTALKFEKPDGTWGSAVDLKGEKGEPGLNGISADDVAAMVAAHDKTANAHGLSDPESPFRAGITSIAQKEAQTAASNAVSSIVVGSIEPFFGIARLKQGGGAGLWFHTDRQGEPLNLNTAYFDRHPIHGKIERVLVDGQIMGKIPKFYVKHETIGAGKSLPEGSRLTLISPTPMEGYHLHPAFLNNNEEIPHFLLGCYEASMDATNTKCQSVHGVLPAVSKDFSTFKGLCSARNVDGVEGFMMQDVYQRAAIQLLMLAEFATPDMQAVLGAGRVNQPWDGKTSYAVTVDSALGHKPWRGFHNLYGNVWEMVDGVRADTNKKLEIFRNDGTRAYMATNIAMVPYAGPGLDGWITEMMSDTDEGYDLKDVFIPSAHAAAENGGTYGDAHWGAIANGVCYSGGCWDDGSDAGLFCVDFNAVASYLYLNIGCRLAKV